MAAPAYTFPLALCAAILNVNAGLGDVELPRLRQAISRIVDCCNSPAGSKGRINAPRDSALARHNAKKAA